VLPTFAEKARKSFESCAAANKVAVFGNMKRVTKTSLRSSLQMPSVPQVRLAITSVVQARKLRHCLRSFMA
jgi:hypothetical protein